MSEKSRDIASGVVFAPQAPISISWMLCSTNYGIAKSLSQLGDSSIGSDTYNMIGDHDILVTYDSDSLP